MDCTLYNEICVVDEVDRTVDDETTHENMNTGNTENAY